MGRILAVGVRWLCAVLARVEPPPPHGPLREAGSAPGKGAQPPPGWMRGPRGRSLTIIWGEHTWAAHTLPPLLPSRPASHQAPRCRWLQVGRPAGEGPPLAQPTVSLTQCPHSPSPKPPVPSRPGAEGHLLRHRAFATATAWAAHTSPPCVTQEVACFDKTEQQAGKLDKLGCTKAFPLPHSSPRDESERPGARRGLHGWPATPRGSVTTGGVAALGWATCQTGRGTCSRSPLKHAAALPFRSLACQRGQTVFQPLALRPLAQISEPETGSQVEAWVRQNPNFCSPSQTARPQVNSSPQGLGAQEAKWSGNRLPELWPDAGTAGDGGHGPQGQPVAAGCPGLECQEGGQAVRAKTA